VTDRDESALRVAARRLVTVPAYLVLAGLSLALAPLWLPAALLADALRPPPRTAARCGAFFSFYLLCESAGILLAFGAWLLSGTWAGAPRDRLLRRSFALQTAWGTALFAGARRIFALRLEVEGAEALAKRPLLLLLRHASVADTLLPVLLVSRPFGTRLRYVLKRELLWDPCLDIVGRRLPNAFVDRFSGESEREAARVRRLVADLGPDEGVVLYPEGTRFTEAKRARVLARLRESADPDRAARAERLRFVLPPRLGGTLALLEANPGADVVIGAHAGFEGLATFWDLWRGVALRRVLRARFWRIPYAELPRDPEARAEWLLAWWERVDAWVGENASSAKRT